MSDLSPFFEKAINSPEGKTWSQQLWLNHLKGRPLVFGNTKGKSTNGHPFEGELDLNLKTSKNDKQYALGFIKIQNTLYDLIVFPSTRKGMNYLKYDGYLTLGTKAEKKTVADVEIMEFTDPKSNQHSYSLRLKPPRATTPPPKQTPVVAAVSAEPQKRGWSIRPF